MESIPEVPSNTTDSHTTATRRKRRISAVYFVVFNTLVSVACLAILYNFRPIFHRPPSASIPLTGNSDTGNPELIWQKVPSSTVNDLTWISCYEKFECAKLEVPLDYAHPETGNASIAMTKVPSKVPKSSSKYRGPMLFNPGGPGGSGIDLILSGGELLQTVIGDDYDLIGFDPRGVGRTYPTMNIFADEAEGTRWRILDGTLPLANATQDAVASQYAQSILYGTLAAARTMHAAPFISTALVCRDMLSIVHAHGRDKLQYWGFSYGTVLGATFAAMFPDHVERLVIDGVEDSYNYYSTLWSNNLVDTDKALKWYLQECISAGPTQCALYESSLEKIQQRYNSILASLKARPIAIPAASSSLSTIDYGIVDYALVLKVIFAFLYSPYPSGSRTLTPASLANALAAAGGGDGMPFWELFKTIGKIEQFTCNCPNGPDLKAPYDIIGALTGISCSDGDEVHDSPEELQTWYDTMALDSSFAVLWPLRVRCAGWKVRSVERYSGPFVGNTSFPILLIGNTADPVTPLRNAEFMSIGYNHSVVLTQNSAGHCSLAANSACTAKAVREYFRYGKLPEPGTVCEVESKMFPEDDLNVTPEEGSQEIPAQDLAAVDAWKKLSDIFRPPSLGMML